MTEDDARRLLVVRAIESEDASEALLTREDRQHATRAALAELPAGQAGDPFLTRRSEFAFRRLVDRFPAVEQACRRARWPAWIGWAVPLGALLLGLASSEIGGGKRLNIIAFPLVGMVAWNLLAYLLLLGRFVARLGPAREAQARPNRLANLLARVAEPAAARLQAQPALARGLARFARDWLHYGGKLNYSRASRTLHLSAALLAGGALAGMYLRALGVEYRAGWESTFMGAAAVERLLDLVLGPASALTGIALPDAAGIERLRWERGGGGANAGPWIHLYATTSLLVIIVPRLLLAGWHAARAARLARRFPAPGSEDVYVRRLLRSAEGRGSEVRVIPYSYTLPERTRARLEALITDVLGERTRVVIDPPIAYGGEDEWLAAPHPELDEADHLVLLFNLSATPEAENQGALVAGVRRLLAGGRSGAGLSVLIDAAAFRARLGGGAEARVASRAEAWDRVLAAENIKPVTIDLDSADGAGLARRIEEALTGAPVPARAGAGR